MTGVDRNLPRFGKIASVGIGFHKMIKSGEFLHENDIKQGKKGVYTSELLKKTKKVDILK